VVYTGRSVPYHVLVPSQVMLSVVLFLERPHDLCGFGLLNSFFLHPVSVPLPPLTVLHRVPWRATIHLALGLFNSFNECLVVLFSDKLVPEAWAPVGIPAARLLVISYME